MKLGLLSDLHHEPAPSLRRRWINLYEPAGLLDRVVAAGRWFAEEAVDVIVVSGDAVEAPDESAFDEVLGALTTARLPVALVPGNHDGPIDALLQQKCREYAIDLLGTPGGDGAALVGHRVAPRGAGGLFASAAHPSGAGRRVIVSHFPIVSEADRLTAAGLPYPGDLTDRAEVEGHLQDAAEPVVVLCGHIHARCARGHGFVLQFAAGALVEPPHEAAIAEIDFERLTVCRRTRRLGPAAAIDPVFAGDEQWWQWRGDSWVMTESRC